MTDPSLDASLVSDWLALPDWVAQCLPSECEDETTGVLRALDQAFVEQDRTEILAQYDRAIQMLAPKKCWRSGRLVAQRVYEAVQRWQDYDSGPYARVLAQFDYNYALEFHQAHVFGEAEDLLREACELFEGCGDAAGTIRSQHQLGRVLQARGEVAAAEQCYHSSLQRAQESEDRKYVCRNLFQLGELAHVRGDLEASLDWYTRTQALAEEMQDDAVVIAALHQKGIVEQMRAQDAVAADHFQAALACSEKINNVQGAANALHQLGMLVQARGELSQAEELYRASLMRASTLPDPVEQAPTLYQLAQCAWTRGDYVTAKDYCERSLSLIQAQGNLEEITRVRRLQRSISGQLPT